MPSNKPATPQPKAAGFGTFGGVFTPCTLTILGVIMFLRCGQVVGTAGVWQTLTILLAAKAITVLTTLSLAAITTNTRVEGGGAYYMISRSLGGDFGGAIGLVFFLAQAISVSMYVIGFTEALTKVEAIARLNLGFVTWASLVNLAVFACVFIGAGWTIKMQYGILSVLGLSLVSFFAGAWGKFDAAQLQLNLAPAYGQEASWFTCFALFFPAATGIMAGANMSGDLKDPGRAIPRGTLASIGVTALVYLAIAICLGGTVERARLDTDNLVMMHVAAVPWLITAGIFAATLSSALGSMMGAPRILQALARDNLFESLRVFAHGSGPAGEPRPAIALTFAVSQAAILLGNLDLIAPVISMFFLITYGYLNLATFYEAITHNPSWRPRFRYYHWATALAGAAGCGGVMLLISPIAALSAMLVMFALQWLISRRKIDTSFADARSGSAFANARRYLLRLEDEPIHPKNWRPSILALSGHGWSRPHLAVFGHWLSGGRGLLTLAQVIVGEVAERLEQRRGQEDKLRGFIRDQSLEAFPAVIVAPGLGRGIGSLVQCAGIGRMRPNLVLSGWSSDVSRLDDFAATLRTVAGLQRSIAAIRPYAGVLEADPWHAPEGPIDVWWRGKDNGPLMLLLAHLLTRNVPWRKRPIRLIRMISAEGGRAEATAHLERLASVSRIDATPHVIVSDDFVKAIRQTSTEAAVVFLGFQPPGEDDLGRFVVSTNAIMTGLNTVILVWSAGEVQLEA